MTENGTIYIYKKSYVRTSSADYGLSNPGDKVTHLTNNCFQVLCDTYGKHEDGNIISLEDLEKYIKATKYENYSLNEHFFPFAKSHVIDTILSGQKSMYNIRDNFELFGFDLMIDEDLRVWLIECNTNPHLGMPNEMMKTRVPAMLNEMLTIVLDPLIKPKKVPEQYETGQFWKVYEDRGRSKGIRQYVLIDHGLYPVEELA